MSRTPTKWILLLSVLMVLAFAKTGFADLSGSELVELMRGSENAQAHENGGSWLEAGEYLGYILGVKEGTDDIASALNKRECSTFRMVRQKSKSSLSYQSISRTIPRSGASSPQSW